MAVIGIMDSGIGGLSVYKEIQKVLPGERYLYYADSAFCPYGDKDPSFIRERCFAITCELISQGAEIVVVACNTATAAAISFLRESFDIPFIGMEPAVKPAALGTKTGVIGVLATAGTLKGSKYLNTKGRYSSDIKIVEKVGRGFVEIVEGAFSLVSYSSGEAFSVDAFFDSSILTSSSAIQVVSNSLVPLLESGADTIVLGCTHYPFLLETMRLVAGSGIRFIDPAPAVATHLIKVLKERGIVVNGNEPSFEFLSSKVSAK